MNARRDIVQDHEAKVLAVGCGRWMMGDDQVGLLAASQLAARGLPGVRVEIAENPDCALAVPACSLLVVIDAARPVATPDLYPAKLTPGQILKLDGRKLVNAGTLPPLLDTHSFGVLSFLHLASALGCLPEDIWVYGLVGQVFSRANRLSVPVAAALSPLVSRIAAEIVAFQAPLRGPRGCSNAVAARRAACTK